MSPARNVNRFEPTIRQFVPALMMAYRGEATLGNGDTRVIKGVAVIAGTPSRLRLDAIQREQFQVCAPWGRPAARGTGDH